MKIFTVIVVALIVALLALAALSPPDSAYGKWPVLMQATTAASLLVMVYFAAFGWLRRDKYIMGAMLFLLLDAGIKLAMLPSRTNAFGLLWGVLITLTGSGLTLLAFGVIRIVYIAISTRSNPFNVPRKENEKQSRTMRCWVLATSGEPPER